VQPVLESPIKLTISVTNACNLNCAYCYGDCGRKRAQPELSTDELLALVDDLAANGIISVFFEGGEPLLRPDMMQVLGACTPNMMTWLRTNATLVTPDVARDLKRIGVGTVCVDMCGATRETHEALTGVAGSYDESIAGIRNLVAAGLPTLMLIILNRRNKDELQAYVDLADTLGVGRVGILRLYPLGRARENWRDLACSMDEMTQALAAIKPPPSVHLMQSWHPKNGNCCWENAAVLATGESVGCPYLREAVDYGNIRETSFFETWNHPLYKRLRAGPKHEAAHCPDCASKEGTRGGCRATAYAFTGDWDAADPFCAVLNKGADLRALPR
jgi:radical SAM protein with 4Fe4S-binding SPASM domain